MSINRSVISKFSLLAALSLALSACETTPPPAPVVVAEKPDLTTYKAEIFVVEEEKPAVKEVPSIDIAEWEAMQAEKNIVDEPDEPEAVKLTPLEKAAKATSPDAKIRILSKAGDDADVKAALTAAYEGKLEADRGAGKDKGVASALVYLAALDSAKGGQSNQLAALGKYAEAQELDPSNTAAPEGVSTLRDSLSGYADELHKKATMHFVGQDFQSAVDLWDVVLLISPDNRAARDWRTQASKGLAR